MWFRYYIHEFISSRMAEIESEDGMLQLEHQTPDYGRLGDRVFAGHFAMEEYGLPHAEGNVVIHTRGEFRFMADTALMDMQFDIPEMTLDWVNSTDHRLFRNLSEKERLILFLIYTEDRNWKEIAELLDCDVLTGWLNAAHKTAPSPEGEKEHV